LAKDKMSRNNKERDEIVKNLFGFSLVIFDLITHTAGATPNIKTYKNILIEKKLLASE
jgi:hypothetical protein